MFIKWVVAKFFEKEKSSFWDYAFDKVGNTIYEAKCNDCGYKDSFPSGGGHTSNHKGFFHREFVYCQNCLEPLRRSTVSTEKGEERETNYNCPVCGAKTKEYKAKTKVKLKCPKCKSQNLEIIDTHSRWMT